ncbi:MAG: hypothetical protein Q4G32_11305 [Kocuria sp.]|nr:hypothetical protein [Kocuria sp.]MDO5619330.1 hypothetical protein [Kocuria sp.]
MTVDADRQEAQEGLDRVAHALDEIQTTLQSEKLRDAVSTLQEEALIPELKGILNRISSAVFYGGEAVRFVREGDDEMAGRSELNAGVVIPVDMPGRLD